MSTTSIPAPLSRRPKRADAARNYDKLIAAGREAFTEEGAQASLEDIARRAEVGIGTLYRNFPHRQALLEAVYLEEVDAICRAAGDVEGLEPWDALVSWLESFSEYATTKKALFAELTASLDTGAPLFVSCRGSIAEVGEPLLKAAQDAGLARSDVQFLDVIKMVSGMAGIPGTDAEQTRRILGVAIDGLRVQS